MHELKTESDCRVIYHDIANGYTYNSEKDSYIRHFTESDSAKTEITKRKYLFEAEKAGLLSEKEKLELLDSYGHWTKEQEKEYKEALEELNSLRYSLKRLIIPLQVQDMEGKIEAKIKEINEKFSDRYTLLGTTREQFANNKASINHIIKSFYKDSRLLIPFLSEEEFDYTTDAEIEVFINIYDEAHRIYTEKNIKRIAVCPFFLNSYLLAGDDIFSFWGKPIYQLTIYQLSLLQKGRYYKNILSEPGVISPPEEFYDNLDSVIQHYDKEYSIAIGKKTNNQLK